MKIMPHEAPEKRRRGPAGREDWRYRFSRYHVAKMMEMRDGLGWPYRRIAQFVDASSSGVYRAITAAEKGECPPEVTPYYYRVCPEQTGDMK